jgi:hypothetical protein
MGLGGPSDGQWNTLARMYLWPFMARRAASANWGQVRTLTPTPPYSDPSDPNMTGSGDSAAGGRQLWPMSRASASNSCRW